jgi:hypothetical protein
MILDGFLQFDSALLFVAGTTGAIGTTNSTNVIDLGLSGLPTSAGGGGARDIGIGDDPAMKLLVQIVTTVTSGGAPTLTIQVQGAPDNGSGAPGSYTTMLQSSAYALATLIQGARLLDDDMPRQVAGQPLPRFLRVNYVIATATLTGGNISAFLVLDRHDLPEQANAVLGGYPAGINIAN